MIRIIAMLILSLAMKAAYSQTTLNFCAGVEKDYCYFNNTKFITPIDSSQALIFMMIKNPNGFGTTKLKFDIYSIEKTGKENLINTVEQAVENDWDWVWKSDLLKTPGKYRVKVTNHLNNEVANKSLELILP
jgi:hypothetical protein